MNLAIQRNSERDALLSDIDGNELNGKNEYFYPKRFFYIYLTNLTIFFIE